MRLVALHQLTFKKLPYLLRTSPCYPEPPKPERRNKAIILGLKGATEHLNFLWKHFWFKKPEFTREFISR